MEMRCSEVKWVILLSAVLILGACDDQHEGIDGNISWQNDETSTCISCHTDKDLLKEVADPEEEKPDSGEG
jgi:hypothetical protein